jgi:hypothetical protein
MRKPNTSLTGNKEAPSKHCAQRTAHCVAAPPLWPTYRLRSTEYSPTLDVRAAWQKPSIATLTFRFMGNGEIFKEHT